MIKYLLLLFSLSFLSCSESKLKKANLNLTILCKDIDPQEVVEYLTQLNLPKANIKLQNDTILLRCSPNFDSTHIAKLRQSGLKYEIYPTIRIPKNKLTDSIQGYAYNVVFQVREMDSNIIKQIKNIPEIDRLNFPDEWFYWKKNSDSYDLIIVDKRNKSVITEQHINAFSIGFESKRLVMEITHSKLGQQLFYEYTTRNKNKIIATLLQNNLIFAPEILEGINSPSVWITSTGEPAIFEAYVVNLLCFPFKDKVSVITFDIK